MKFNAFIITFVGLVFIGISIGYVLGYYLKGFYLNHVNETSIKIAKKCIKNLYAVTDSMGATGLKDGIYKFFDVYRINTKLIFGKNISYE